MKLSESQRFELYRTVLAALVARESWPKNTPPDREGKSKPTSSAWALATWANRIAGAAAHCIEKDEATDSSASSGSSFS